jgi:hypothetical protein
MGHAWRAGPPVRAGVVRVAASAGITGLGLMQRWNAERHAKWLEYERSSSMRQVQNFTSAAPRDRFFLWLKAGHYINCAGAPPGFSNEHPRAENTGGNCVAS